jgi:serine/threonine-protein kinase HipA
MRAAQLANINTPQFELSQNGKFLIVTRFDLKNDGAGYYGFEDFCVLNGFASEQKYDASYESICKRIKAFVSPEHIPAALQQFFKTLVLSCMVRNGDAHLKNFGVLYDHYEATVSLAPCYDIVCTTAYHPADTLALLLGGSKRWPQQKTLIKFAGMHCNIPEAHGKILMNEVAKGLVQAATEMTEFMRHNEYFREVGQVMLAEWDNGLSLSGMAEGRA